jgi:hypothetical protein
MTDQKPPANALRVERWTAPPTDRAPAKYQITDNNGESTQALQVISLIEPVFQKVSQCDSI